MCIRDSPIPIRPLRHAVYMRVTTCSNACGQRAFCCACCGGDLSYPCTLAPHAMRTHLTHAEIESHSRNARTRFNALETRLVMVFREPSRTWRPGV
eukprot:7292271-Prymnesium_polylepis.1